eukprot:3935081-Rhodomonas_salina.1
MLRAAPAMRPRGKASPACTSNTGPGRSYPGRSQPGTARTWRRAWWERGCRPGRAMTLCSRQRTHAPSGMVCIPRSR